METQVKEPKQPVLEYFPCHNQVFIAFHEKHPGCRSKDSVTTTQPGELTFQNANGLILKKITINLTIVIRRVNYTFQTTVLKKDVLMSKDNRNSQIHSEKIFKGMEYIS